MLKEALLQEIRTSQEYFERSSRVLEERDSSFRPAEGMLTAAQQIEHVAATIHWFVDGALSAEGFDLDFEHHMNQLLKTNSITAARESLKVAFEKALTTIGDLTEAEISAPIVEGMVMGGEPRYCAFLGIVEHTAHHRGSLAVYTRLLNKTPLMPYMEL